MKKISIFTVFVVLFVYSGYAARPTVQATTLTFNNINCDAMNLNWTNGDGSARLIIASKTPFTFTPTDGDQFTANPAFGASPVSTNPLLCVVYNANGTNFVKVTGLQPGQIYYFAIFEHDNNNSTTEYLTTVTSGANYNSESTKNITMDFTIENIDSCQMTNSFKFTNNSASSIPGLTYLFDFGDGTSTSSPVVHHFTGSGGYKNINLIPQTSLTGCPNLFKKNVKIFPKKIGYIDNSTYKDSQCLEDNYYEISSLSPLMPFPMGVTYHWWFGDGLESTFPKMKKKYTSSGTFNVMLELNSMSYSKPTACKDTIFFTLTVLPSPVGNISINDTFQCLKHNKFDFNNPDNSLTYFKWYFGDEDSSIQQSVSHVYRDTGNYKVMHVAFANSGCKGRDTIEIVVLPDLNSTFTGLDSFYCSSGLPVNLMPADETGTFVDYNVNNNTLIPDKTGNQKLTYVVKNEYCADTTVKYFNIYKTPTPVIGKDSAICNINSFDLSANTVGDSYLWSTNETTPAITVYNSGMYTVEVTVGKCPGKDSINLFFASAPKVDILGDTILCKGGGLWLNAAYPKSKYNWNTGSTDSMIYAFQPGKYKVTVSNPCGVASDSMFLYYQTEYCDLFMANAFSPGNDLVNNVFMPRGRNITVTLFQIYNRWGELIFETDQNNSGWDGTFKGDYVQEGLYLWKLNYTTPNGPYLKKGNAAGQILLIR